MLSKLLNPLKTLDSFLPESITTEQNATLLLRARVLMALCLMYLSSTVFIALVIAISNMLGWITLWSAVLSSSISSIIYLITIIYFRRTANLFWSANLFVLTLFCATLAFVYVTGGLYSPVMMILMCVCVCAFLVSGRYVGMFWTAMVALFYILFFIADFYHVETMQVVEDSLINLLIFFCWFYAWGIMFGGMALFGGLARNLSDTLNLEREQLRIKAVYDPVTGAYNRQYLRERLSQHLARCNEPGRAFLFIDIEMSTELFISRDEEEALLQKAVQVLQNRYPGRIEPFRSGGLSLMAIIHDVSDPAQADECGTAVYVALRGALDELVSNIVMGGVMVPAYSESERDIVMARRKASIDAKNSRQSFVFYSEAERVHVEDWTPKNWRRRRFSEMVSA